MGEEYLRKDGTRVPILVGVALLDDQSGEGAAFILDLTERKRAESAIEELREEREASLQASIRLEGRFLAVAGHELKTPLTALLMQIQSLRRAIQKDSPARLAERLEKAANAGLRLERLIDQLLDVSRITAGRLRLEPEALNLADLVEDVVARFIDASIKQNDSIVVSCEPVVGRWDRLRIEQVINNLVANALKYGGESPVEISLHQDNDTAVLEVVDRGIGIDEAHQQKIFQRFERAVAARDFGGLGLGLWITRQIIEASGGTIEVESAPGEGSTFTVRLPLNADRNRYRSRDNVIEAQ